MATELVGYARVYRSALCEVRGGASVVLMIPVGSHRVSVSIGKKIRLLIPGFSIGPATPKRSRKRASAEDTSPPEQYPPPWKFGAPCYTELVAVQRFEIADSLSEAFRQKDRAASAAVMKLATDQQADFVAALDTASSLLGLYLSPLLIRDKIAEYAVAFRGQSSSVNFSDTIKIRTVQSYKMHVRDRPHLQARLRASADRLERARQVAPWLLRAWDASDDPVTEFTSLFVPFEMVLEDKPGDRVWNRRRQRLQKLVQRHGGKELAQFVSDNIQRPPLLNRFAVHAGRSRLRGWRNDVHAARQFNKVRNALLHRGRQDVATTADVGERQVLSLADLVHRYVGRELYGRAPRQKQRRQ